jgi:hypothetical protein
MIRRLLDVYTQKHQQPLTKRSTGRGKQRRAGELSRPPASAAAKHLVRSGRVTTEV